MTGRENESTPETDSRKTGLGLPEDYGTFPAAVTLDGAPYWLVRGEDGEFRLLLAICPHAGGEVLKQDQFLYCPMHFWTFDPADGTCHNAPGERLLRRKVEQGRDGRLYADGDLF